MADLLILVALIAAYSAFFIGAIRDKPLLLGWATLAVVLITLFC